MRKKILFFGLGSIGTRHLRLIKYHFDLDIYAYRTENNNIIEGVKNIFNLEEALNITPDIAFITNPTFLHIETAIRCLDAGIRNIFIEKPLSHSLQNLDEFLRKVENSDAMVYVGYSMRFNPIIKYLKDYISENLDDIFYAFTFNSSYLPNWRPGREYEQIYSSKKDQGGGVILDLIHEFDFNEWFFGKIKSLNGKSGKISKLNIDSEDYCDVSLEFENNIRGFIHLDYFGLESKRLINIFSTDKQIIADLLKNQIIIIENSKNSRVIEFKFERDDYFKLQLKYFFESIDKKYLGIQNLRDAKELLEKLLNFKQCKIDK